MARMVCAAPRECNTGIVARPIGRTPANWGGNGRQVTIELTRCFTAFRAFADLVPVPEPAPVGDCCALGVGPEEP
jgi:hypothetical protein